MIIFINMEVGHQRHLLSEWNADLLAVLGVIWCDTTDQEGKKKIES